MGNKWTDFVKEWAAKNNMSYGCAMSKQECKDGYKAANPKPSKSTARRSKLKKVGLNPLKDLDKQDLTKEEMKKLPTELKGAIEKSKQLRKVKEIKRPIIKELIKMPVEKLEEALPSEPAPKNIVIKKVEAKAEAKVDAKTEKEARIQALRDERNARLGKEREEKLKKKQLEKEAKKAAKEAEKAAKEAEKAAKVSAKKPETKTASLATQVLTNRDLAKEIMGFSRTNAVEIRTIKDEDQVYKVAKKWIDKEVGGFEDDIYRQFAREIINADPKILAIVPFFKDIDYEQSNIFFMDADKTEYLVNWGNDYETYNYKSYNDPTIEEMLKFLEKKKLIQMKFIYVPEIDTIIRNGLKKYREEENKQRLKEQKQQEEYRERKEQKSMGQEEERTRQALETEAITKQIGTSVVKITYKDRNFYLNRDTNIVYDPKTKNPVGLFDLKSNEIKSLPSSLSLEEDIKQYLKNIFEIKDVYMINDELGNMVIFSGTPELAATNIYGLIRSNDLEEGEYGKIVPFIYFPVKFTKKEVSYYEKVFDLIKNYRKKFEDEEIPPKTDKLLYKKIQEYLGEEEEEEEEEKEQKSITVVGVKIGDKSYYLSKETNVLFDKVSKEPIGILDLKNKKILPLPESDDEEDDEEEEEGAGIMGGSLLESWVSPQAWKDYGTAIIKGRKDYPPKVREIIKKYKNVQIVKMYACRTPVKSLLTDALNVVSMGAFNKRWDKQPYDKLFHLDLRVELATKPQISIILEKNEVVNAVVNPPPPQRGTECSFIPNNKQITLEQLLDGGQKFLGQKFFTYSATSNNCQDFIMALLRGSGIGTQENYDFIKQDTKELFKGLPGTRKIANTVTDLGSVVNTIIEGASIHKGENYYIQSVVFDKQKFDVKEARKWLKQHNYVLKKADVTDTQIRFRQVNPSYIKKMGFEKFRTKKIGKKSGIELIISYK